MASETKAKTADEIEAAIKENAVGLVPDHWDVKSVADLVAEGVLAKIQDGNHGEIHPVSEDYVPSGVPFIMSGDIWHGRVDVRGCKFIRPEHARSLRVGHSKKGDVLLTHKGNELGRSGVLRDADYAVLTPQVTYYRVLNQTALYPEFLRWLFESPRFQHQFKCDAAQSTRPFVSITNQQRLYLLLPPLAEQRRIAHILGTLDDKIDLNRRMNATLEAMARALFQSWFVNFDPVRAKAAGQTPAGMDPATAALFPSELEDSELGEIPKGWEVKPLADVIEIRSGGTPSRNKPEYWNGDIPWFSVKDAPADGDVWAIGTEEHITKEGVDGSAANVLPLRTTIISARGTVGKLALTGVRMAMNQSCYGLVATPACPPFYKHFLTQQVVERLQQISHGGVFDTITKQTFAAVSVVVPPRALAAAYDGAITPMLEQQHANVRQSRTLAALRDALLPKLLSGELSLAEVAA